MRTLGILLLMLLPVQAMALSCVRPSVERSFEQASAAAESYVVVKGRLTLDARKMPKAGASGQQPRTMTRVAGTLTGKSLTKSGFNVPFEKNITLEVGCVGPWCGSAQNGEQVLAFVRRDADGYTLGISPCGGLVFANPKRAMIKKVQQCFKRGSCAK